MESKHFFSLLSFFPRKINTKIKNKINKIKVKKKKKTDLSELTRLICSRKVFVCSKESASANEKMHKNPSPLRK